MPSFSQNPGRTDRPPYRPPQVEAAPRMQSYLSLPTGTLRRLVTASTLPRPTSRRPPWTAASTVRDNRRFRQGLERGGPRGMLRFGLRDAVGARRLTGRQKEKETQR